MFSEVLEKTGWDDTTARIMAKTAADVEIALSKPHLDLEDFMALVSPAAAPYLEQMAALSRMHTLSRFGKTISMYVPMYITNRARTHACTAGSTATTRCAGSY